MTHLSHQITHLVSARPMSVTMDNAFRELQLEISGIDIDMIEQDVRWFTCMFRATNIEFTDRQRIISMTT